MRRKILIALGVVTAALAAFLTYVAFQPPEFKVVRSVAMSAPPEKIFPHINDFHAWDAWSPWAKLDPNAKNEFSGAESGVGAVFQWSGNSEVGEGKMTLLESVPSERVRIRLDFTKPFADTSHAEFTIQGAPGLAPGDETPAALASRKLTRVTWSMEGKNNFIGRVFCTLFRMDKMLGDQFVTGLASLKRIVEDEHQAAEAATGATPTTEASPAETTTPSDTAPADTPSTKETPANDAPPANEKAPAKDERSE